MLALLHCSWMRACLLAFVSVCVCVWTSRKPLNRQSRHGPLRPSVVTFPPPPAAALFFYVSSLCLARTFLRRWNAFLLCRVSVLSCSVALARTYSKAHVSVTWRRTVLCLSIHQSINQDARPRPRQHRGICFDCSAPPPPRPSLNSPNSSLQYSTRFTTRSLDLSFSFSFVVAVAAVIDSLYPLIHFGNGRWQHKLDSELTRKRGKFGIHQRFLLLLSNKLNGREQTRFHLNTCVGERTSEWV